MVVLAKVGSLVRKVLLNAKALKSEEAQKGEYSDPCAEWRLLRQVREVKETNTIQQYLTTKEEEEDVIRRPAP